MKCKGTYSNYVEWILTRLCFIIVLVLTDSLSSQAQISQNIQLMAHVQGPSGMLYNDIWGYVDSLGNEFAVIGGRTAIFIYNVNDCANPQNILTYYDGSNTVWRDFKTYRHYIYATGDGIGFNKGLQIINMNTSPPTVTNFTTHFQKAHNIFIDEPNGRLYVVGSNTVNRGLIIYDLNSNPANPTMIKSVRLDTLINSSLNTYVHDVYVEDNIAYCSTNNSGYSVWDVSDVNNIQLIDFNTGNSGYNHSSWKHPYEEYYYVAYEVPFGIPIRIFKRIGNDFQYITEFNNPLEAPQYTNCVPHNPFVKGDTLYISYYHDGLQVYDVGDPENPRRIGWYDTYPNNNGNGYSGYNGCWGTYPFLPSGCILASDISYGLFTFKVIQRAHFVENGHLSFATPEAGFILSNENNQWYLVNADLSGNLTASLVENPEYNVEFSDSDLFVKGAYQLFLRNASNQIFKFDISTSGAINNTPASVPATGVVNNQTGNIKISKRRRGIVMEDSNGQAWRIGVDGTGQIYTTKVDTPQKF